MTDHLPDRVPDAESADLEYDLAHEAEVQSTTMSPESDERRPTALPEMPADSGDYSYDLAHDIPRP